MVYFAIPSGFKQISSISRVAGKMKNHYFHQYFDIFYEIFDFFKILVLLHVLLDGSFAPDIRNTCPWLHYRKMILDSFFTS